MTETNIAAELRSMATSNLQPDLERMDCLLIKAAQEIDLQRAALKVAQQAILEFNHAQECGPNWYTRGKDGMYQQVNLWLRSGLEAVQGALGPYDDNGQYLKEMAAGEPGTTLQRYFTHGDLLELPADAEIDELGQYEGNTVVYLASDIHTGYSG